MSFYRTMLGFVAAAVIATPVFADDNAAPANPADNNGTPAATQQAAPQQVADATSTATQGASDQQTSSTETKINLNKASTKELMKVKGINATKARAIVAYRKKHGNFSTTDDLLKVKGFKKMKSDNIKEIEDQLSVE